MLFFLNTGGTWSFNSVSLNSPIKDEVILKSAFKIQLFKQPSKVTIIWSLFKFNLSTIVHVCCHFFWVSMAQILNRSVHFAFLNLSVLFLLGLGGKALPWELSLQEIEKDIAQALQVVSAGLLVTEMRVEGGVSSCSGQVLPFFPWNVLSGLGVSESLRQAEIDKVDVGGLLVSN